MAFKTAKIVSVTKMREKKNKLMSEINKLNLNGILEKEHLSGENLKNLINSNPEGVEEGIKLLKKKYKIR